MPSTQVSPNATTSTPLLCLQPVRQRPGGSDSRIPPGMMTIGSSSDCSLSLNVPGIADQHVEIITDDRHSVLLAHDPRTWLNDGPVKQAILQPGDRIAIGPVNFASILQPASTPPLPQRITLYRRNRSSKRRPNHTPFRTFPSSSSSSSRETRKSSMAFHCCTNCWHSCRIRLTVHTGRTARP